MHSARSPPFLAFFFRLSKKTTKKAARCHKHLSEVVTLLCITTLICTSTEHQYHASSHSFSFVCSVRHTSTYGLTRIKWQYLLEIKMTNSTNSINIPFLPVGLQIKQINTDIYITIWRHIYIWIQQCIWGYTTHRKQTYRYE